LKETGTQVPHGLLLEELQRDFPLVSRPFRSIGRRCGLPEERTLETTRELLSQGMIREISAILDARRSASGPRWWPSAPGTGPRSSGSG
jgi:hypothetical protein